MAVLSISDTSRVISVDLPPVEVTLFEDRAHVVRRGRVALPAGEVLIRVDGVAPVVADRTLSGYPCGAVAGVDVVDVRIHRERLVSTAQMPEELQLLEKTLTEMNFESARASREIAALETKITVLRGLMTQTAAEIAVDVGWGRGTRANWSEVLDPLAKRLRDLCDLSTSQSAQLERLDRKRAELVARVAQLKTTATSSRSWLEMRLTVAAPVECELAVSYMVPGACWRPAHTARLAAGLLTFATDGCAWQNTGEDWTNVRLGFSTQRLSRGTEPPPLGNDLVKTQRKQPVIVVEKREQQIATTGPVTGAPAPAPTVPGIDDGGETRLLWAPGPVTMPADGRPHRVPVFSFQVPATTGFSLMAELVPGVFSVSDQINTSSFPVLAGPVDLIRDSGYVGRSTVLFVAPGQRFTLDWGLETALSVHRDQEVVEEEPSLLGALSAWSARAYRVVVRVSNLGAVARVVDVTERIPVSEVEKVQVVTDPTQTTDRISPDADGFLRWKLTLAAFGHLEINHRYRLRKHRDVVEG